MNRSYSHQPTPQPLQCRIWARSAPYTIAHHSTGSLTHCARPGIEPTSSLILVRFVNRWATGGPPTLPLSCWNCFYPVRFLSEWMLYTGYLWRMYKLSRLHGDSTASYSKWPQVLWLNELKKTMSLFCFFCPQKRYIQRSCATFKDFILCFTKEYVVWEVVQLKCILKTVYEKPHFLEKKKSWILASFHFSSESRSKWSIEFFNMPTRQLFSGWHMNWAYTHIPAAPK